jgi:hypothetical protein
MKSFRELFSEHEGNLIDKWDHYFEIYDRYFTKYRNQPVNILEIGISHGGSLQLWRKYFGEQAQIFAVDVNEDCRNWDSLTPKFLSGRKPIPFSSSNWRRTPLCSTS